MLLRSLSGALVILALPVAACGSSSGGGGSGGSTGSAATGPQSLCDTDKRAEPYAVGLSAKSADGSIKISFMDANPAPPAKGENTWTIQVTDAANKPVTGASITLQPYMPDHGHGSSITPKVAPMPGAPGLYDVTLVDLFMPGIWQNTFSVTLGSAPPKTVVFTFCVDG